MRYAMRAASQLPGKGPTYVDNAPAPARTTGTFNTESIIYEDFLYSPHDGKSCWF